MASGEREPKDGADFKRWIVAGAVMLALVLSALAAFKAPSPKEPPGIALGSQLLLDVERTAAFFAVALFVMVVLTRAWDGQLPDEISGRGVKYLTREDAESFRATTEAALRSQGEALEAHQRHLVAIEEALSIPEPES